MIYEQKNFEHLLGMSGLSDNLLKNHLTLYQGYVINTNKLLETMNNLLKEGKAGTPEFGELKRRFAWEFNGMRLHEYYFENIARVHHRPDINSGIFKKIAEEFGSYENWEKEFRAIGAMRGIGWVILCYDKEHNKLINIWINEHDVGHLSGAIPILVMDVFEHAYMLDYGLKRVEYLETFFRSIDWTVVTKRFNKNNESSFNDLPSWEIIEKTIKAVKSRGINVELVNTREEALGKLMELIPPGVELMTGGSTTLDEIGFTDILKDRRHEWNNLKDEILLEKDQLRQAELRKKSITSQYFLGSVHAVTEAGDILIASASGSQIPSYAFSSDNVIWVVGAQKIVSDIENGFRRIQEYVLPLEDKRMKSVGYPGSTIGKILVFEREIMPNRKVTLILVNEKLGF